MTFVKWRLCECIYYIHESAESSTPLENVNFPKQTTSFYIRNTLKIITKTVLIKKLYPTTVNKKVIEMIANINKNENLRTIITK